MIALNDYVACFRGRGVGDQIKIMRKNMYGDSSWCIEMR